MQEIGGISRVGRIYVIYSCMTGIYPCNDAIRKVTSTVCSAVEMQQGQVLASHMHERKDPSETCAL